MSEPMEEELSDFRQSVWPAGQASPTRVVRCRHCGQKNRISVPVAALTPDRVDCGACHEGLFLGLSAPLWGLRSVAYEHSLDRTSLAALKSLPALPQLLEWLLGQLGDRSIRILLTSDAIQCGDEQFPELLALMDVARERLGLLIRPTLFLGESPHMNALTTGVQDPMIIVRSGLLDQMDDAELVGILGHELGHLHAGHPLYQTMARAILAGGFVVSGAVRLLGWPLEKALLRWARCAELTADRAALLATRSPAASIRTMLKFAGGNRPGTKTRTQMKLGPFIRQVRGLAKTQADNWLDGALATWLTRDRTHPFVAWRVMHLLRWIEHGNYLTILAGDYARASAPRQLTSGGSVQALTA